MRIILETTDCRSPLVTSIFLEFNLCIGLLLLLVVHGCYLMSLIVMREDGSLMKIRVKRSIRLGSDTIE
jgi:hypothetical protein